MTMTVSKNLRRGGMLILAGMFSTAVTFGQRASSAAPPDRPAAIRITGKHIEIRYDGQVIFHGEMNAAKDAVDIRQVSDEEGKALTQVIKFTSRSGAALQISGTLYGSEESFPCSADRQETGEGEVVRASVGLSHSLLNRAVYDRKKDWVLSVDDYSRTVIEPLSSTDSGNTYRLAISGSEIILRFRPRYYQFHRGLRYYEPWTYTVWHQPVVGWSSWFAYEQDIDEQKIRKAADIIAEKLHPYGYDYIQIDDGYEQEPIGLPDTWLHPNPKFPSGLGALAGYIRSKELIPGIWTNVTFQNRDSAFAHKSLFVQNEMGEPAKGRWIGYPLDGSNPAAIDQLVRPVYHGLKEMGWQYFKVDALRHLRYEGYNSYADYFARKHVDRVAAYRKVMQAIRNEVGRNSFILACWGIRPELTGLVDACRIGTDGYSWQGLAQYNSFNNVVWRNDPDHVQLSSPYAYRDCMLTSMTGSLLMLTDKPQQYLTGNIEPAIRSAPVLFTLPGQLYDVDPSRSIYLDRVNTEMSGSGPRVFDAGNSTPYDLFLLELNEPYENWMMLGRVGESRKYISFKSLGLDEKKPYLVFEFWSESFRGIFTEGFKPGAIDTAYRCQLFCIRALQDHPQLMATNRHISCGALELKELKWNGHILSGISMLPAEGEYILYIHEPAGFRYEGTECSGAVFDGSSGTGNIREVHLRPNRPGAVSWSIRYK